MKTAIGTPEHDDDKNLFKRCGCADPGIRRRRDSLCPRLVEPRHGAWYFAVELRNSTAAVSGCAGAGTPPAPRRVRPGTRSSAARPGSPPVRRGRCTAGR
ncbi:MAG: hypothetical protein HOV76_18090 [Hamadaea sp.]|nr:hypothetical protein [Hamadaea sp.]